MNLERILVPLDGSHLAEASLPAAEALARRLESTLILVHILEPDAPETVHGQAHLTSVDDAIAYLETLRARHRSMGIAGETHVEQMTAGRVALAIDDLARRFGTDLIAMCAHGPETLRGRLVGPIAQQALRSGTANVLLRTPGTPVETLFGISRILVPVDFHHDFGLAESAVRRLALGFGATVRLLNVPEQAESVRARLLPHTTSLIEDWEQEQTRARLTALARKLQTDGIATETELRRGSVEEVIVEAAPDPASDLIVLVTHAHAGLAAWYERSIGAQLIRQPGRTLLLIRQR